MDNEEIKEKDVLTGKSDTNIEEDNFSEAYANYIQSKEEHNKSVSLKDYLEADPTLKEKYTYEEITTPKEDIDIEQGLEEAYENYCKFKEEHNIKPASFKDYLEADPTLEKKLTYNEFMGKKN